MKGIFLHALAHPRLDRARLHPSRRRVLAAPVRTDANQLTFPDRLGFARPFAPSSPRPMPGSGRDESAAGPSEPSARPIERRGLFPTSPTKLVSQM